MSKNVAVFVDVANIFYAAKAAGVDIDYVTLLKAASAGRDLVRAYAYTGLDPENENQRQFHAFLARNGYKVVSKDIRKYGDGKVKANLDIELVVDLMRTSRNLDIAVVVSGDGDFAPAIRAVQQTGIRVEVISFRGNTSSDLIDVADVFTDITQIARVERSSRSGRRVAAEEDLSMTEVPEKETEGTGRRRRTRRGEGREEGRREERRGERRERAPLPAAGPVPSGTPLVVLPGEKLSRVAAAAQVAEGEEAEELVAAEAAEGAELVAAEAMGAEGQEAGKRRRRRRGGRGRGRGRGQEQLGGVEGGAGAEELETEEEPDLEAPRLPQHSTFGSVWDSQLGMPSAPVSAAPGFDEEEELEEPEIPEYLLAERRQRGRGGRTGSRGGPRGGRAASYQQAVERERYGRGSGGGVSSGGRSARPPERGPRPQFERQERARPVREPQPEARSSSSEPWSEVPPEVAELLRAELARRGAARPEQQGRGQAASARPEAGAATAAEAPVEQPARAGGRGGRGRARTAEPGAHEGAATAKAAPVDATATPSEASETAPRGRGRSHRVAAAAPGIEPTGQAPDRTEAPAPPVATAPKAAPARRRGRTAATAPGGASGGAAPATPAPTRGRGRRAATSGPEAAQAAPAPGAGTSADTSSGASVEKATPRRTRRTATTGEAAGPAAAGAPDEPAAPVRRRTTRRAASAPEA